MALANRIKKRENEFTPIDLTEENVQKLFKRCLATEQTTDVQGTILFSQKRGYKENSSLIAFDNKKLAENLNSIRFLLGQLKFVHEESSLLTTTNGIEKYDSSIWTKDPNILMQLLYLGQANGLYYPFQAATNCTQMLGIIPSFSPKDPKFAEWYATGEWCHEYDIEQKKKSEGPDFDEK